MCTSLPGFELELPNLSGLTKSVCSLLRDIVHHRMILNFSISYSILARIYYTFQLYIRKAASLETSLNKGFINLNTVTLFLSIF